MALTYKTIRLVLLFLAVLICYSCSHQLKKTQFPPQEIQTLFKTRCSAWSVFEATFRVKSTANQRVTRYTLHVWRKGKKLKLDVFSIWGQTVATAVFRPDSDNLVWFVDMRKVYLSRKPEKLMRLLTGINLQPLIFVDHLCGCYDGNYDKLLADNDFKWCGTSILCGVKSYKPVGMSISYEPGFDLAAIDRLPSKIKVAMSGGGLELSLRSVKLGENIPEEFFELGIPSDVLRYRL